MTEEDGIKLARIFETADGGCIYCAYDLAAEFNTAFPDLPFQMQCKDGPLETPTCSRLSDEPDFLRVVRK